jgi:hypothetical protein
MQAILPDTVPLILEEDLSFQGQSKDDLYIFTDIAVVGIIV